jgi:hypothetical protein
MGKRNIKEMIKRDIEIYKKHTDIYENKKKVQIIYLDLTTDDFYKEYSTESLLKNEVYEFIEDTYDVFVTNEKKFKLDIEYPSDMDSEEKSKIEHIIAVHYAVKLDEIKYDIRREILVGLLLFIIGLSILIPSIIVSKKYEILGKVMEIISWAFIWESALRFFLETTANYRERVKYKELYIMAHQYHDEQKRARKN